MLTDEQYQEIEKYLYSPNGYFDNKYLSSDYFEDEWEDIVDDAARTADVTPGYPAKITDDPGTSEPPEYPELNKTDADYGKIVDRLFATWLDTIRTDMNIPELIRNNLEDDIVKDLLEQGFMDTVIPYGEDSFYDAILDKALEVIDFDDDYTEW